jgi:uncharacterized protein (DUF1015 family)
VGDLAAVISPPYDVIAPEAQARLLARHPRNSVRLDLPEERPGDRSGARYARAAADLAAWQQDGTLRRDPDEAIYPYEQTWGTGRPPAPSSAAPTGRGAPPTSPSERVQRGFFARLRLEDLGSRSGVLRHERTLSGPKEDRYRLLQATGANLSPIMGLYQGRDQRSGGLLPLLCADPPVADVCDDDGVRHRLWRAPLSDPRFAAPARALLELAGSGPITLADGHHRYETALRYRDERRAAGLGGEDSSDTFVLALLFDTDATDLEVLPTHRLVRGAPHGAPLLTAAAGLFRVEPLASADALAAAFDPDGRPEAPGRPAPTGRLGLYSDGLAAILYPRRDRLEPLLDPGASELLRWLPVSVLAAALEGLLGVGAQATAAGRLTYTKNAREALGAVDAGAADSAFLLEPIPAMVVQRVAEAGELMPQKSTYFYPKPATGLLFSAGDA